MVSLTRFVNKPHSTRDLTIFMISTIFSFVIINIVAAETKIILCVPASAPDAAAVNANDIKVLLVNGFFSAFFIKGKPVFSDGPRSLPRNPLVYNILDS